MKADLESIIHKITKFLGKTVTDEQMKALLQHVHIDTMRENKYVNKDDYFQHIQSITGNKFDGKFINKGQVGTFKEAMTPETIEKYDKLAQEIYDKHGFKFNV